MRWSRLLCPALLVVAGHVACAQEETDGLYGGKAHKGAQSGASCVDHCGGASEDESCWCDPTCDSVGDCCSDILNVCGKGDGAGGSDGWPPGTGGAGGSSSGGVGGFGGKPGFGGASSGGSPGVGGSGGGTAPPPNSCKNLCGGQSMDGSCFCNPDCQQFGDCCPDFFAVCGGSPIPTGGCTPNLCLSDAPTPEGCYCDPFCMEYGDCCPNWIDVCF